MQELIRFVFFMVICVGSVMASEPKHIFGYIENVRLTGNDFTIPAKLDTGAKSASLNARDITQIERDGKPYLRFVVPSKGGEPQVFVCEYVGDVNIKVRAGEVKVPSGVRQTIKRPLVLMSIQLGEKEEVIRVNLTNRKRFLYPLLLGRDALIAFNGVVDPALTFTIKKQHTSHS